MRVDYPDGSFMLSWEFCRAWFAPDGTLKDAEYKRMYKGYPVARAVSAKHTKVRAWLEEQGKVEVDLLARGILKRKD
jgi:hypothetical protein